MQPSRQEASSSSPTQSIPMGKCRLLGLATASCAPDDGVQNELPWALRTRMDETAPFDFTGVFRWCF